MSVRVLTNYRFFCDEEPCPATIEASGLSPVEAAARVWAFGWLVSIKPSDAGFEACAQATCPGHLAQTERENDWAHVPAVVTNLDEEPANG